MRVFDCILLGDELDLLEMRMRELEDIPEMTHVIAECPATPQGEPRSLCFQPDQVRYGRFRRWHGRWTHVVVEPGEITGSSPKERRDCLREYLRHGLSGSPGDLILHGSITEIPRADAVRALISGEAPGSAVMEMRTCAYRPGLVHRDSWLGTASCRYENLPRSGSPFTYLREQRHRQPVIVRAGTRLAHFGEPEQRTYPDGTVLREVELDHTWPGALLGDR
jgi:hypothetical protein